MEDEDYAVLFSLGLPKTLSREARAIAERERLSLQEFVAQAAEDKIARLEALYREIELDGDSSESESAK